MRAWSGLASWLASASLISSTWRRRQWLLIAAKAWWRLKGWDPMWFIAIWRMTMINVMLNESMNIMLLFLLYKADGSASRPLCHGILWDVIESISIFAVSPKEKQFDSRTLLEVQLKTVFS